MKVSSDSDFQINIKRKINACFVKNYFGEGLQACEDILPVFNYYKAVTYMCTDFSKAEDETSEAMKQAAKEALTGSKLGYDKRKAITRAYTAKRECSAKTLVAKSTSYSYFFKQ